MKLLDPNNLQPWELPEIIIPAATAKTRLLMTASRMADQERVQRYAELQAEHAADKTWLRSNFPEGTLFRYLNTEAMVVDMVFQAVESKSPHIQQAREERAGMVRGPEQRRWHAVLDVSRGPGVLVREAWTVSSLRAAVEPGYVKTYSRG